MSGACDVGASLGHHATHQMGRSSVMVVTHATGDAPKSHSRTVASEELLCERDSYVPCSHNTTIASRLHIEGPALVPLQCGDGMTMELPPNRLHIVHGRCAVVGAHKKVISERCMGRRKAQCTHRLCMFCCE